MGGILKVDRGQELEGWRAHQRVLLLLPSLRPIHTIRIIKVVPIPSIKEPLLEQILTGGIRVCFDTGSNLI